MEFDLRSALADALPAAGPPRAAVKAMNNSGYKADPKNNDMKELFVGLDLAAEAEEGGDGIEAKGHGSSSGSGTGGGSGGTSAAQALLDYRREQKAA